MEKEDLLKIWKKVLIDADMSAAAFWASAGLNASAGNRKIREGTIKFIEFINLLDSLGYTFQIRKKE